MRRRRMARINSACFDPLEVRALLSTLIALVDSGVDLTSSADSPYYNFTDAYDAYDQETAAQYGDGVVQDTSLQHGHGSTVADLIVQGIQATEAQPGAGGANVQIMPVRDTSSGLNIDGNALIRGVYWAADHGAAVINLSVASYSDPVLDDPGDPHNGDSLSQAIEYAQTKGAVVVTAPGNAAMNIDNVVIYPAYADDPLYSTASPVPTNVIDAAAVDASGNLTSVSDWGPEHVDLGAYTNSSGATSYSAGYTSGVAGVIADLLPPDHTPQDVINVIDGTVTPHAQSVGAWCKTGGVINPAGAVAQVMAAGVALDAGGGSAGSYSADAYYTGGSTYSVTDPINTSNVVDPAPQQVYQTERYGNFSYTLPHLVPDSPYIVRLDFAEIYWDAPNQRLFNVLINGDPVLTNFDIFATAGGKDIAISRQFECLSDSSGQIVIQFTTLRDNAKVSGIQVTPAPDLALGKQAYASSVESSSYVPDQAIDGNSSTRWSSGQWMQNSNIGWIYVDLGAPFNISEVRLNWETAYAVNYQIQVSDDAVNWTTIQVISGNQSKGVADFSGLTGTGRYVRILCTQTSAGSDNYSLYDFNVYGTPITDLAQNRPTHASSVESSYYPPSMAVDGNSSTRWSSGQWMQNSSTGWIYVDLGAPFNISEVRLNWETAYAVNYQIQVSDDAVNWTTIQNVTDNQSKAVVDFSGLSGIGRYVRILCTQTSAGSDNYSLYDFNVYGTPAEPGSLGPAGLLSPLASNAGTTGSSETAAPALSGTSQAVGTSPVGNSTTITTTPPINAFALGTTPPINAFALGTTPPINAFALGTTPPINANLASRLSARGPHQASAPRSTQHVSLLSRPRVLPRQGGDDPR
ncbi:MAG: discoidin domain-containing protein [Isosphaeraceae bacterium]